MTANARSIKLPDNIVTEFDQALTEAFTWAGENKIDAAFIEQLSGWPVALTNAWNKQKQLKTQGNQFPRSPVL
jgi:hypothetical protein